MATFRNPLDMAGFEILRLVLQHLTSDPPAEEWEGRMYYNSTLKTVRWSNGTTWINASAADAQIGPGSVDTEHLADGAVTQGKLAAALLAYLLARANHTGTQALSTISGHDKEAHDELDIDAATVGGATASQLRDRSTHTGTQALSTITGHTKQAHDALNIDAATLDGKDVATLTQEIVASIVDGAPETLDTLRELADALGEDPNFATTITNALATKAVGYSETIGDGASTSFSVEHNLNSTKVVVSIIERATGAMEYVDWSVVDANEIEVTFGVAPDSDSYDVNVIAAP